MVGHTGIGGLTLGGGMGWLTRQAGLACDNLESVEIVVADGRVLRASAEENPDLFWAVRGGGGNFGVVTEFEYRLHEVGPMIQFALLFWEVERGTEALRAIREAVAGLPRSCNVIVGGLSAPPAPFVPAEHRFKAGFALMIAGFGDPGEHAMVVDRLRAALPPLFDTVTPMPYTALNQMFDQANPAWRVSQPMPPPSVRPPMPVWPTMPVGTASPCACVAASRSEISAPPPARARLSSGSTVTSRIPLRSITRPPSTPLCPDMLCAPHRTAISNPSAWAYRSAATTSAALLHRATTSGRRSASAFHSRRAWS
jgi:hypothetical protein